MKYPLVIEDLRKSYPLQSGEVQNVVEVESFELNQGSQLAIQGASGTGKSTFLNLIAGIVKPDIGVIRMGEIELSNLSEHARDRGESSVNRVCFSKLSLASRVHRLGECDGIHGYKPKCHKGPGS